MTNLIIDAKTNLNGTCGFWNFRNRYEITLKYAENGLVKKVVFFGTPLSNGSELIFGYTPKKISAMPINFQNSKEHHYFGFCCEGIYEGVLEKHVQNNDPLWVRSINLHYKTNTNLSTFSQFALQNQYKFEYVQLIYIRKPIQIWVPSINLHYKTNTNLNTITQFTFENQYKFEYPNSIYIIKPIQIWVPSINLH